MPWLRLGRSGETSIRLYRRLHGRLLDCGDASLLRHAVQLRALRLGQLVRSSGLQAPALVEEIRGHHLAGGFRIRGLRKVEDGPVG